MDVQQPQGKGADLRTRARSSDEFISLTSDTRDIRSPGQWAAHFGVTTRTIRNWLRAGRFEAVFGGDKRATRLALRTSEEAA